MSKNELIKQNGNEPLFLQSLRKRNSDLVCHPIMPGRDCSWYDIEFFECIEGQRFENLSPRDDIIEYIPSEPEFMVGDDIKMIDVKPVPSNAFTILHRFLAAIYLFLACLILYFLYRY